MIARSNWMYRKLLRLYPARFRDEYAFPMAQCFRDMCLEAARTGGSRGVLRVWLRVFPDFARSLVREQIDSRWGKEGIMSAYPRVIDRFQVKAQIGDGSVSRVYQAYDPDRKRDVAIKLLKPQESGQTDSARPMVMDLQREVDVLAAFDHPAIPKAYGWVQSEAGAYLVMDYIPGPSLLQVLEQREGFLPEQEIIAWGIQACEVLVYLHSRQPDPWLFRDIKPSNMILDEQGGFHLVDFGTGVTYTPGRCYECIGTEGYAAPEQYQGGEEPRSDLYALGATLTSLPPASIRAKSPSGTPLPSPRRARSTRPSRRGLRG